MANNVGIATGTGATVATDQLVDESHVQLFKLLGGVEDGTERIGGDASFGLDVDVIRIASGLTIAVFASTALPVTDNSGSLTVDGSISIVPGTTVAVIGSGSFTVANGGTFLIQDSEKIADNAGFTDGATKLTPVGYAFDETAGTSLTENDLAAARIDSKRAQVYTLEDATTRGQRATVQPTGALVTAIITGTTVSIVGDRSHDDTDSGQPVKIGGKAQNAMPAAVANNDRAHIITDLYGRQLTSHIDPGMQIWKQVEGTTQATGSHIWLPTSGKKIAVTNYQIGTGGTTAGVMTIWFGAAADATYTQGTDQVVFRGEFAPSSTARPGVVMPLSAPIFAATADHILRVTTSAGITFYVTCYGYEF